MQKMLVFIGIGELLSLRGAANKKAKRAIEDDLSPIKDAAIVAKNGKIAWVGPRNDLPMRFKKIKKINLRAKTVLPAFCEAHTHLIFSGNRADEFERRLQGSSYQQIAEQGGGILSTVRQTRASTDKDLLLEAQSRADLFLRQGVGTLEVKSGYGLNAVEELRILRLLKKIKGPEIHATFLGAHAQGPEARDISSYLTQMAEILPVIKKEKLAKRVDAFIERGYFSAELIREYLHMAKELGFDLALHVEQLSHSGGTQLAIAMQALSVDHVVQINQKDIDDLAASEVTAVLLPTADLYMQCAYPPARALLDAGARVALASDFNPGSCPSVDISLVGLLSRLQMKMKLFEVIIAYTLSAAYALGLGEKKGALIEGRSCDFICLNEDWHSLFHAIGLGQVKSIYLGGKRVKL